MTGNIDVEGAVDVHTHAGPSVYNRRVDLFESALECAEAGMDAVVFKEHHLPTVYGIPFVKRLLEERGEQIELFGSVVLNYCNGGYNPFAVQSAIDYGARAVWTPTIDAKAHGKAFDGVGRYASHIDKSGEDRARTGYAGKSGLYALDDDGDLTEDVRSCIETVVENDVMLCCGHSHYDEIAAIFEYAAELGHDKLVLDHPYSPIPDLTREQVAELTDLGAYVNLMYAAVSPKFESMALSQLYDGIRETGVDRCVLSSDVGQVPTPSSPESLRILGELLYEEGVSKSELETMTRTNPKELVGIE